MQNRAAGWPSLLLAALAWGGLLLFPTPSPAQSVGNTFTGQGAPAPSTGKDSSFYIDALSGSIYGPKSNGTWPDPVIISPWLATWTFISPVSVQEDLPVISSCGTDPPAASAGSSANSGQFTLGTGTPTACTVTFATAFATHAYCTVTPASAGGAAITGGYYISAQSETAFTLTIGTGTNSLVFNYTCVGN